MMAFPEGREAVEVKRMAREGPAKLVEATPSPSTSTSKSVLKKPKPNIPSKFYGENRIKIIGFILSE